MIDPTGTYISYAHHKEICEKAKISEELIQHIKSMIIGQTMADEPISAFYGLCLDILKKINTGYPPLEKEKK